MEAFVNLVGIAECSWWVGTSSRYEQRAFRVSEDAQEIRSRAKSKARINQAQSRQSRRGRRQENVKTRKCENKKTPATEFRINQKGDRKLNLEMGTRW